MKPEGITAYPWKLVGRKRKIWSSRWRKKDGFGTKWAANEGQTPWFVRPHRRPIFALWPRRTSCFNEFANNCENFYIYSSLFLFFNSLPSFNFSLSLVVPRFHFLLIPLLLVTFPSLNGATSFPFGFPWKFEHLVFWNGKYLVSGVALHPQPFNYVSDASNYRGPGLRP